MIAGKVGYFKVALKVKSPNCVFFVTNGGFLRSYLNLLKTKRGPVLVALLK